MRRALQYHAITGRPRRRSTARSRRSRAAARCTRAPSRPSSASPATRRSAESVMVERDLALAALRGAAAPPDAPLGARVGRGARGARRRPASRRPARSTPHHLCLTDEAVRSLDPNLKMNPPLRTADDRAALRRRRSATARSRAIATDHAPHARAGEGRAVRGGAVRRHRARDRLRGAQHAPRRAGPAPARRRCSSGCRPGRRASSGSSAPRIAVGAPANLVLLDPRRRGGSARTASARARRTRGCSARRCAGKVRLTVAGAARRGVLAAMSAQ